MDGWRLAGWHDKLVVGKGERGDWRGGRVEVI